MRTPARPFLFLLFIVLIVSLACSSLSNGSTAVPQVATEAPPIQLPTEQPSIQLPPATVAPTEALVLPTEPPTSAPVDTPKDFFKEEFNSNSNLADYWSYFTMGPGSDDSSAMTVEARNDGLLFDLGTLDLYVYYLYEGQLVYKDTTVTLVAENRGANNNNVSLVCRLDYDKSNWYEYSFESGGLWYLYAVQDGKYRTMDNGGSNDLHMGLATNEYAMTCKDNTITMYINGTKLKTFTDKKYFFYEGQVGFNISSLNVLPITVNVKSFEVSEP
ncbi:MAG: hypothetical protein HZB50_00785 [Chloroflexi bacterium]|nr:hypothetical protein [Chloroflexota bacterium]